MFQSVPKRDYGLKRVNIDILLFKYSTRELRPDTLVLEVRARSLHFGTRGKRSKFFLFRRRQWFQYARAYFVPGTYVSGICCLFLPRAHTCQTHTRGIYQGDNSQQGESTTFQRCRPYHLSCAAAAAAVAGCVFIGACGPESTICTLSLGFSCCCECENPRKLWMEM